MSGSKFSRGLVDVETFDETQHITRYYYYFLYFNIEKMASFYVKFE